MAWPEKLALALFALITVVLLLLGLGNETQDASNYCQQIRAAHSDWTSDNSYCFVTAAQHWSAFASIEWFLFLKIVLPAWVVMRLIDLFGGGPAIRRADRERTNSGPEQCQAAIDLDPGNGRLHPIAHTGSSRNIRCADDRTRIRRPLD
jgi:hypothetical protein